MAASAVVVSAVGLLHRFDQGLVAVAEDDAPRPVFVVVLVNVEDGVAIAVQNLVGATIATKWVTAPRVSVRIPARAGERVTPGR